MLLCSLSSLLSPCVSALPAKLAIFSRLATPLRRSRATFLTFRRFLLDLSHRLCRNARTEFLRTPSYWVLWTYMDTVPAYSTPRLQDLPNPKSRAHLLQNFQDLGRDC
ncbi:hypothetical protein C8R46DRAFT_1186570 [Mycena filopes]|nr:hypothetical protein C8R46DRAFT_1186570 [Mycena filopes]